MNPPGQLITVALHTINTFLLTGHIERSTTRHTTPSKNKY